MSSDLSARGLRLTYPGHGRPAVGGLDLDVPAGDCVALLGRSGSGKSSVLRLLAGLERPDAGTVHRDGRDLTGVAPERRGIAMLTQRPLLFPHLSVLDNVAFPLRVAGMHRRAARERAGQHLELVQLPGHGRRRVQELSGGQAQRVALARALVGEPGVLLLDEPFGALDSELRGDMHDLLLALRAALEPTLVLVTHDVLEAGVLADTVAVLSDGLVRQHAPLDELYHRPADLLVARVLGGLNEVPGEVVDGRHHSVLGTLAVERPDGPAVLLVRQEVVDLPPATTRSAPGTGTVEGVQRRGARTLVTVLLADRVRVHAEVGPGSGLRHGDAVHVVVDPAYASAVDPDPSGSGPVAVDAPEPAPAR